MIKPLLRVLPSLSGNVKLACNITDVRQTDDKDVWEGSIRGARLLPITSHMWQSNLEAGLVSSSWEYDLPRFYAMYSDVFFKSQFQFDKADILKLDETQEQKLRATDFEFGVKRISYKKNGNQYAFFAPLYIDNADDLPAYFEIEAKVYSYTQAGKLTYAVKKRLRVNIANEIDSPKAYIGRYLDRYLRKIDDNVAFCTPLTNQATYYGIDLSHGGFVTAVDNMMDRIYHHQNTIQNFDATIAGAFERNRIAMKQILPLSFYFDVRDFLTEAEQIRYRNSYVEFSGHYVSKDGKKLGKYDFSTDYMQYSEDVLKMNPMTGAMQWATGEVKNIMDVNFPSLNDCRYVNYEYANKLAPWFCRWKMKYSSDEHPYVMNNSWAFSKNQDSNYRYGQFPSTFNQLLGLAKYVQEPKGTYNYNMMFPLGDPEDSDSGHWLYKYAMSDGQNAGPYNYIAEKYEQILDAFCTNWYSVIKEYDDSIYDDATIWENTNDDCVYYRGILYDLRNIYSLFTNDKKIDKFAVIVHPDIHVLTQGEMKDLKFSRSTLYRQDVSQISSPNAVANDSLLIMSYLMQEPDYIWNDVTFSTGGKVNQDEIRFNEIFKKSAYNEGNYIDLMSASYVVSDFNPSTGEVSYTYSKYALDYYDLDKYYAVQDKDRALAIIDDRLGEHYYTENREMRNFLKTWVMPHYGEVGYLSAYTDAMELAYAWLPVPRINEITYNAVPEWAFDGSYTYTTDDYVWAMVHNDCVINVPPEYADRKYTPDIETAYLMTTDGFLAKLASLRTEDDDTISYISRNSEDAELDGDVITIDNMIGGVVQNVKADTSNTHRELYIQYDSYSNEIHDEVTLGEILDQMSYIRHMSDHPEVMAKSYTTGGFNTSTWSYLSILDKTSASVNYGGQYYWGSYMLSSTYFPYVSPAFNAYAYLSPLVTYMRAQGAYEWAYEDLENEYMIRNWESMREMHPAAYWAGRVLDWKAELSEDVSYALAKDSGLSEWEYKAVIKYMDNIIATDVFNERSKWTDMFYGDMIPQSKVWEDNNVLWVDPYNLSYVFSYEGYPEHDGTYVPEGTIYRDMFVRFLNKTHLFYWYVELFKDENKLYDGGADYQDFMYNQWYKNLYVAQDVWMYDYEHDGQHQGVPVRRRVYTPLEKFMQFPEYYGEEGANGQYRSFSTFYNNLNYTETENVFTLPSFNFVKYDYLHVRRHVEDIEEIQGLDGNIHIVTQEQPIKFELCFRKKMIRADERLWNIAHMEEDKSVYRDIYFYRPQSIIEHDEDYSNILKIRMQSDYAYLMDALQQSDTYSYIDVHEHEIIIEGEPVTYYTYTEEYAYFDEPHVFTDDPMSYMLESDSMLTPLFDDIFMQPAEEALVYTHYALHDITEANVVEDKPDAYTGEWNVIHTNYRFGQLDKTMMIEISQDEREKYRFSETYEIYDNCYPEIDIVSDDLGFGYLGLSTKIQNDGTVFGFYYITSYLNNTSNTFNITGVTDDTAVSNLRYINMINGVSILERPGYITTIFKELAPFINQQILSVMADATSIVYPKTYPFDMIYSQIPVTGVRGATETEIIKNTGKLKTTSLLRYFHAMTPWIKPVTNIQNEWRLKLKNVDAQLLDTGKYISIGDAPIYKIALHIDKFVPYTIYTSAYGDPDKKEYDNPLEELYTPVEYKFYNASRGVILEPKFSVKMPGKMTYKKLLENETDEVVMKVFSDHVTKRTHKRFTDTQLVFLLNKYSIAFDSVPSGLDLAQKEKLYELSIVFELL